MNEDSTTSPPPSPLPADDHKRNLTLARPESDQSLSHIGLAGDTYTILLSGGDTNGRYCLIDMFIPPGGGPAPHRHDFEESFSVVQGEIEATFRGKRSIVCAGETLSIPANAPHSFKNASDEPARLLCICAPAGQEDFFTEVGVKVSTRTTPPPKPNKEEQAQFVQKAQELCSKIPHGTLKTLADLSTKEDPPFPGVCQSDPLASAEFQIPARSEFFRSSKALPSNPLEFRYRAPNSPPLKTEREPETLSVDPEFRLGYRSTRFEWADK